MQGHFDLALLDTPGLTQELIEAVRREGGDPKVEALLKEFRREGEWKTDNLIYQVTPSYLYYWAMSGPVPYGGMESNYGGGSALLAYITLVSTSGEPTYNGENYIGDITWDGLPDNVGSSASKYFVTQCIVTPEYAVDPGGREAIYVKSKWLFLPGQATSSVIRSVALFYSSEITNPTAGYRKVRVGRVRIKDSGGNPVTISKAASKSLLVEYTFTLPTT